MNQANFFHGGDDNVCTAACRGLAARLYAPLPNSFEQSRMEHTVTGYMLFVTSQYDVIFNFANQSFGEVCWHNMHIILHALSLLVVVQCVAILLLIEFLKPLLGCTRSRGRC